MGDRSQFQDGDPNNQAEDKDNRQQEADKPNDQGLEGDGEKGTPNIEELINQKLSERELLWQKKFDRKNTELQQATKELEKLRTEKMSQEERAQYELEKERKEIETSKAELQRKDLEITRLRLIHNSDLDHRFEQFITGEDEKEITQRIKELSSLIDETVAQKVQEKLATSGAPKGGESGTTVKNPWAKETLNLTEQAKIMRENPGLAEKLKSEAGGGATSGAN